MGFFTKSAVLTVLLGILLYYIPSPPNVTFTAYEIPGVANKFTEAPNNILDNSEKLFENDIHGPEGFATFKNKLYFSAHYGFVYELNGRVLRKALKLNPACAGFHDEKNCGRPLGIKFDKDGNLYIAAVNYGLLKANVSTGTYQVIDSLKSPIEGKVSRIPNSLDISKDGSIYWSDSSTANPLEDGLMVLLADGNGRVLKYDPVSKKNTVLLENLVFANGVALSPDESVLFVAETGTSRVHRVALTGQNKGQTDVFIDKLPGYPDNLRISSRGNLIVTIIDPFYNGFNIMKFLAPKPYIRKLIYNLLYSIHAALDKLNEIYPLKMFEKLRHSVGHIESTALLAARRVLILEINMVGNIVKSYASNDGSAYHVCDMIEYDGYYYLGSPYNHFLGRKKIAA